MTATYGPAYRRAAQDWLMGLAPANPFLVLGESRSPWEFGAFLLARPALQAVMPKGDGQPVLIFPGLGSDDDYSAPMRGLLNDSGYRTHPWKLGTNRGMRRGLFDAMKARLAELHDRYDEPINLVGWSLGGTFARELAKAMPDQVRQVITLGSPFADPFKRGGRGEASQMFDDLHTPPPVPTTSIFTRTDGIIDWRTTLNPDHDRAENIEVAGSHIGLGFNPAVLYAVADRISQPAGEWAPFTLTGLRRLFFCASSSGPAAIT